MWGLYHTPGASLEADGPTLEGVPLGRVMGALGQVADALARETPERVTSP
jgi:hypothetical protein